MVCPERRPVVADLFCGAGGLSLGLLAAGFDIQLAIDHDHACTMTYARNIGEHIVCAEISIDASIPNVDVIAGGPPCQGFSSAGPRRTGDHRNSLVGIFADIIINHRPRAFIFENVEGFLTTNKGQHVLELLEPLIEEGYCIHLRKVNAADYGVPQHRKRVIAIGGLGWKPSFPEATHRAFGAPGAFSGNVNLPRARTLADAFLSLPPAATNAINCEVSDHYYRPLATDDLVRVKALDQGQTMRDLPEELWHNSYRRRAHRRVMDGTPTHRRGGPPAGLRRLRLDQPSKAITSGARAEFVHPVEHRYLTLRECARIQTFPDAFEFCGTMAERAVQIGNAVPPQLATVIAKTLFADLCCGSAEKTTGGALLSFIPTVSEGVSPALQHLTDAVAKRFDPALRQQKQLNLWL